MYPTPPPGFPAASSSTATSTATAAPAPSTAVTATAAAATNGPCGHAPSPNAAAEKRVLYVGNLAPDCTEQMLVAVFAQFGQCMACKIIRTNGGADRYAFMEFPTNQQAQLALSAMNHISLMDRELRVNWATTPGTKPDPNRAHNVFVGDLQYDIEENEIMDVFVTFGPISECKVVRSADGGQKTYAFLTFDNDDDANSAIAALNGTLLRHRPMRVAQASRSRNGGAVTNANSFRRLQKRSFDDVYHETSLCSTSVYVGGIQQGLSEDLVRENFKSFGNILDVKVHNEKGYAFVRYDSHDNATKAIVEMQGAQIGAYSVKVGWGRDQSAPPAKMARSEPAGPVASAGAAAGTAGPPGSFPTGQAPLANDPTYSKYYEEYMRWYRQHGQAYYAQYYQQYGQQAPSQLPHQQPSQQQQQQSVTKAGNN